MTQLRVMILALVMPFASPAFATSGWDEYGVSVGHYSIAGAKHAFSGVWLIGPDGSAKPDPIIRLTPDTSNLDGPPGYLMLREFLLLRYIESDASSSSNGIRYFAIQHKDYGAIGPMTLVELESLTGPDIASYGWKTPSLPSSWSYVVGMMVIPAIVLLSFVAMLLWIALRMSRFRKSKVLQQQKLFEQ